MGMSTCKVCGRGVRKTTVALIKRGSTLKGARVCAECVAKLGVTIVVAHEAPHCKCGKPATKCGVCAGNGKTPEVSGAVKLLKARLKTAKMTPIVGDDAPRDHAEGRIEGLESAIELLESGRF